MIEQVQARVALSSTAYAPVPGLASAWVRNQPTVAVHAVPVGGGAIAGAFGHRPPELPPAPVWATEDLLEPADGDLWRPVPSWGLPTGEMAALDTDEERSGDAMRVAGRVNVGPVNATPAHDRGEQNRRPFREDPINNGRYGQRSTGPTHPVSPAPNPSPVAAVVGAGPADAEPAAALTTNAAGPVAWADPAAWAARLRSQSTGPGEDRTNSIRRDFGSGSELPRRNAGPATES
jgi:hypothetical protein